MVYCDKKSRLKKHLVADSLEELHSFAKKIGLGKHFFHNPKGKGHPHYDLLGSWINRAIDNGAVQVDNKTILGKSKGMAGTNKLF
jgi:hypothetical protein